MSMPAGGPIAQERVGKYPVEETGEVEKQPVEETEEVAEGQPVERTTRLEAGIAETAGSENRETTGTATRAALELTLSHGTSSVSLKIDDPYVAVGTVASGVVAGLGALVILYVDSTQLVEVSRGFGKAAGVAAGVASVGALTYLWVTKKKPTETAISNGLEGRPTQGSHARDPEVEDIRQGSLLVKIRCHSRESLVRFIQDYNSGRVKQRLLKELSEIGLTGDLKITIENREELEKHLQTLSVPTKPRSPHQRRGSGSDWSPHQRRRLGMEKEILSMYFRDKVKWINPTERKNTKVESRMTTSNDKSYTLRIYIPADYPNSCPTLVVRGSHGLLSRLDGTEMTKETLQDHTHGSRDGLTVICHFRPSWWTGGNTLYQVLMKGLIWLEAYEGHLCTGKPLSAYLRECITY